MPASVFWCADGPVLLTVMWAGVLLRAGTSFIDGIAWLGLCWETVTEKQVKKHLAMGEIKYKSRQSGAVGCSL